MQKKLIAILFSMVMFGAGCDRAPQPPLLIGIQPLPGAVTMQLAQEIGAFADANLKLDVYSDTKFIQQALRDKKLHLATLSLDEAILLRKDIPDLKIILLFDRASLPDGSKRIDVLVARDEAIGSYHRELGQLLRGWRQALDQVRKEPEKSMQAMAQYAHLTTVQLEKARKELELFDILENQRQMLGEPAPVGSDIVAAQRALLNRGLLSVGADPAVLLDATLLAGVAKQEQ